MTNLTKIKMANLVLFQAGWLACVLGAARGYPWAGTVAVAAIVVAHLSWSSRPGAEVRLLAVCGLAGILFDGLLLASGWVTFPNGWWLPGLAPYWMLAMWLLFGTTLNLSIAWLRDRPALAATFGAIGGPLAYLGGEKLGGISLTAPFLALIALAVGWGVVTPTLTLLAKRLDGFSEPNLLAFVNADMGAKGAANHG